jgi:hypothetical protein
LFLRGKVSMGERVSVISAVLAVGDYHQEPQEQTALLAELYVSSRLEPGSPSPNGARCTAPGAGLAHGEARRSKKKEARPWAAGMATL